MLADLPSLTFINYSVGAEEEATVTLMAMVAALAEASEGVIAQPASKSFRCQFPSALISVTALVAFWEVLEGFWEAADMADTAAEDTAAMAAAGTPEAGTRPNTKNKKPVD